MCVRSPFFFFFVCVCHCVEHQACEETTVEYNGIRYVCYFTEKTYGSISAVLKANRCALVSKQWDGQVDRTQGCRYLIRLF